MANHKSAKIRIKSNAAKTAVNDSYTSKVRTLVKKVEAAVARKDKKEAETAFVQAESALAKATQHGVMKKAAASRKTSRLSASIKKI